MNDAAGESVSTRVFTIPNLISFARLCLLPVFLWLYLTGHYVAATVLLAIVGASDFVDGYVARHTGQVSVLGKLLDPLADRLVIVAVLVAFGVKDTVPWVIVGVIVGRDLVVMIAFAILEKRGLPRLAVNKTGKRATASIFTGFALAAAAVVMKVAGSPTLRSDAHAVREAAIVVLVVGATLYWTAGWLYAAEVRRQFQARAAGGTPAA